MVQLTRGTQSIDNKLRVKLGLSIPLSIGEFSGYLKPLNLSENAH